MLGAFALFVLGVSQLLWGTKGWIIAAVVLAVASFVWSGYKAWKDCLFDPFIAEVQDLIQYLEKTVFDADTDTARAKQLVRFPFDAPSFPPAKIECNTEFRLIRFAARLQSHKERAERLLPGRCLSPLIGFLSPEASKNLLSVQQGLATYKQALESEKARWF